MTETLRSAVMLFRRSRGLADDEASRRIWLATLGQLIVPLPNFDWRREILARNDVHHLLTGFDTTVGGELSVAAWELGVGCYASPWARLLCVGLLITGLIVQPRQTINAYRHGRRSAGLYAQNQVAGFLDASLADLRQRCGLPLGGLA